jgi:hypothetical protein
MSSKKVVIWATKLSPVDVQTLYETPMESWKLIEQLAADLIKELRDTLESPKCDPEATTLTRGRLQFARQLLSLRKDIEPLVTTETGKL